MDTLHTSLALRCGLEMSQRIAMAPLTNTQSNRDGSLAQDEFRWLTRRARDGFRWISTCASFVSEQGHAWQGQLGIAVWRPSENIQGCPQLVFDEAMPAFSSESPDDVSPSVIEL